MAELRYVILHHHGIADPHYDLMFETAPGSPLRTWRAPRWPLHTEDTLTRLPDHRRDYLDYQGPLSGDRGAVRRVQAGQHRLLSFTEQSFATLLDGAAEFTLIRTELDRWRRGASSTPPEMHPPGERTLPAVSGPPDPAARHS